jgi:TatD DNase family protein
MIPFTDTHCHLNLHQYHEDREKVLKRAWIANLVWILNPGIDLETSREAVDLAKAYPKRIYAAIGIHPNYSKRWTEKLLQDIRELARQPEVVAIGEIGLDYYRQHTPFDQQQTMFKAQLQLAGKLGLPVIIHNRESTHDLMEILSNWYQELVATGNKLSKRPGVLHSYSADLETALAAIEMNFYIGISGPVTFTNAPQRKSVTKNLPLDHLLLETDAPYLAPHPHRGKRNEPAYIPLIAEEIAHLHDTDSKTVASHTYTNACQLFQINNP